MIILGGYYLGGTFVSERRQMGHSSDGVARRTRLTFASLLLGWVVMWCEQRKADRRMKDLFLHTPNFVLFVQNGTSKYKALDSDSEEQNTTQRFLNLGC